MALFPAVGEATAAKSLNIDLAGSAVKINMSCHVLSDQGNIGGELLVNRLLQLKCRCQNCKPEASKDLALLKFDAEMPAHRHGMITKAKISKLEEGVFLIAGVKFHMPGVWIVNTSWKLGNETLQVAMPLNL